MDIASGLHHNLILDTNNQVWGFGYSQNGEIGTGAPGNFTVPIKIECELLISASRIWCGAAHSFVEASGLLYGCGSNRFGELGVFSKTTGECLTPLLVPIEAKEVFAGYYVTIFVSESGNVFHSGQSFLDNWGDFPELESPITSIPEFVFEFVSPKVKSARK
jgi:alpha-tubulin suppressor-like RCC1 family protein